MAAVSLADNSIGVGSPAGSSCVAALSIDHLVLINGRVPLAPRGWVPRCNWIDPLLLPVKYCPLKPLCRETQVTPMGCEMQVSALKFY